MGGAYALETDLGFLGLSLPRPENAPTPAAACDARVSGEHTARFLAPESLHSGCIAVFSNFLGIYTHIDSRVGTFAQPNSRLLSFPPCGAAVHVLLVARSRCVLSIDILYFPAPL